MPYTSMEEAELHQREESRLKLIETLHAMVNNLKDHYRRTYDNAKNLLRDAEEILNAGVPLEDPKKWIDMRNAYEDRLKRDPKEKKKLRKEKKKKLRA